MSGHALLEGARAGFAVYFGWSGFDRLTGLL
jgi:hypothetical protein